MINKLRIKFIVLSMVSLVIVLAAIIIGINLVSYRKVVEEADEILEILGENHGSFPMSDENWIEKRSNLISPEIPYESRYFSVLIDSSGDVDLVNIGNIAAVDSDTAVEYARRVLDNEDWSGFRAILERKGERGFFKDYRYLQKDSEGETLLIFLDCWRSLHTFRSFRLTSCVVSLLGLLAVFVLMALISGWMIGPVSESYEKQKRFITDAGHEIKTPLAIINADADVLGMDIGENEWLQDIQKQSSRLAELTESLISLARMEENSKQFQMEDFLLSDVAAETAQSFQALAKSQGKTFTSQIQPLLSLRGDERSLRQLITILLDNALKYSGEAGEISLSLGKQGRTVRLRVYNTAESVQQENIRHMFDRFYRADSSRNSNTGGYGIGLSIAKAIVDAHKGKIAASTEDGHSMLVTVSLPA